MYEETHKARKNYICNHCDGPINRGELYVLGKGKEPRFDEDKTSLGKQIGIKYYQFRLCDTCIKRANEGDEHPSLP
ncbi:hypothetical protein LCGC14_2528070 [marine sediment metagenome]|uniref:Uncharacterized protein n=1 Tax=marine sediment metagenome TaxID=412755 RepID=A0A0F9DMR2_9ZZZZ